MRILACFIRSALVVALAVCPGCYDGELLLREARSTAVNTRLVEVDLGRFLTTLPRDRQNNTFAELDVHLFAAVPRSRVTAVKKQLKAEEYRLRHELLAAVRGATAEELAEPSLAGLRDRIERVVNGILNDSSVKSIGFYQLKLQRR
jgi:flagellar basal body-associated protein FliL